MAPLSPTRPVPTVAPTLSWRRQHAFVLVPFTVLFVGLAVATYTGESATWDEPIHLTDGYYSLARGDYRVDIEHPPLVRMWAALPLLLMSVRADASVVDTADPTAWVTTGVYRYARQFVYVGNDGDRLLYAARFMIVLLGVLLGVLLYAWAHELYGWPTAVSVLALYTLEPNIAAHAHLVTTDFGLTCFIFGAVYFAWRAVRRFSVANVAALALFTTLAVTSKFSAIILVPILIALAGFSVVRRELSLARAAMAFAIVAIAVIAGVWAVYRFRFLPGPPPNWMFAIHEEPWGRPGVAGHVAALVNEYRLLPNAFIEGAVLTHFKSGSRVAYLAGELRTIGWWYYFPAAFLLKTPLTIVALAAGGLLSLRAKAGGQAAAFVLLPIALFLGWAMTSHINIGLRHILPIYPFVLLVAGSAVATLLERQWKAVVIAVVLLCGIEAGSAYPHTLAFFNVLAGGPSGGSKYLVDSNVDWGQDLKGLKRWMNEQQVDQVNLAYFGVADPAYYGIDCTFLPGSPSWVPPELVQQPRLPGYVAVSATLLRGAHGGPEVRHFYEKLASLTPIADVGYSILVYRVERPWW